MEYDCRFKPTIANDEEPYRNGAIASQKELRMAMKLDQKAITMRFDDGGYDGFEYCFRYKGRFALHELDEADARINSDVTAIHNWSEAEGACADIHITRSRDDIVARQGNRVAIVNPFAVEVVVKFAKECSEQVGVFKHQLAA